MLILSLKFGERLNYVVYRQMRNFTAILWSKHTLFY